MTKRKAKPGPKPGPELIKVTVVLCEPDEPVIVRFSFTAQLSTMTTEVRVTEDMARALVRAFCTKEFGLPQFELRCDLQREGLMDWLEGRLKHPTLWINAATG